MSINIDKKLLRKALELDELARSAPLVHILQGASTISYDGEYLSLVNTAGQFSVIGTGYGSPAYEAGQNTFSLIVAAKVLCVSSDADVYIFFLEPRKAVYNDYQGFRHDGVNHCFEFRNGGAEEQDNITGQDWTVEHEFKILHKKDRTVCRGYIDGALVAECTDITYISAQPFSIYAGEPNGVARTVKLKLPPGIYFRDQ